MDINLISELNKSKEKQEKLINLKVSDTKVLLAENEANRLAVLKGLGLQNQKIKDYEYKKEKSLNRINDEKIFGKYVFHIDEIKYICIKYDLKFLGTNYYNGGGINSEFTEKVIEFAKKHDIRINLDRDSWGGDFGKFKILAPREKFKKKRSEKNKSKDKEPILFYKTNNNFYKVVYSRGNSFTNRRILKGWRKRNMLNRFIHILLIFLLILIPLFGLFGFYFLLSLAISLPISALLTLFFMPWKDDVLNKNSNFFTKNGWNSSKKISIKL